MLLFSGSVVSDSLWPHELQHARLPCPSPSLRLLKLLSIELVMSSDHLILCHPRLHVPSIFPRIRVSLEILMEKYWWQNIGASASASVLPINIWIIIPLNISFKIASLLLFSHSVMSDFSWPHGLQHARLPCPSPSPGVYSNLFPLVSDAIQPSHPLSSPSPPALNLSQHQGLFWWVGSLHQEAKVLELQLQQQSFQWIFRVDFL